MANTEQGAVEHVYTVGSCKDDDTTVGTETIHLCKESVQGVLALIITTKELLDKLNSGGRSQGFYMHGKLFILTGEHYVVYDGKTANGDNNCI